MENFVANSDGKLVVQYSTLRARSKLIASYSQYHWAANYTHCCVPSAF